MEDFNTSSETGASASLNALERVLIELELAFREGELTSVLQGIISSDPPGERIIDFYRSLATSSSAHLSPFREDELNAILVLCKQAIRTPLKWFPAVEGRRSSGKYTSPKLESTDSHP
jgi:hypothetical protein